jgi:hypothetical protein
MEKIIVLILSSSLLLAGCATPYRSNGLMGGYSNIKLSKDMYKVSFQGNGYTNSEKVENYLLYRCAELTNNSGYRYFIILEKKEDTKNNILTTPTTIRSIGNNTYSGQIGLGSFYSGNNYYTAHTTINPGETYLIQKHTNTAIIKMLKSNEKYPLAIEANSILSSMNL